MRLEGKTAFITGAASGMGRAAALRFAAEGARLGLIDIWSVSQPFEFLAPSTLPRYFPARRRKAISCLYLFVKQLTVLL